MARDYAKKNKQKKRTPRSSKRSVQTFSLLSFFRLIKFTFIFSLLVMSGFYLSSQFGEHFANWLLPEDASYQQAKVKNTQPQFEFYNILPKGHEKNELKVKPTEVAKPSGEKNLYTDNGKYILQVASFKSIDDADRLKAELTLKGFDVSIAHFRNENHIWYRVKVGPFKGLNAAKDARATIAGHALIQRIG